MRLPTTINAHDSGVPPSIKVRGGYTYNKKNEQSNKVAKCFAIGAQVAAYPKKQSQVAVSFLQTASLNPLLLRNILALTPLMALHSFYSFSFILTWHEAP